MLPFEKLLERFRAHKLLRERGKQRTDSTHVLAAVHALNRLSCAGQTFRHALNVLATVAPDWFLEHSQPEWVERYAKSFEVDHTIKPSKQTAREALEREVAADGLFLLNAVFADDTPAWLSEVPVIQLLWRPRAVRRHGASGFRISPGLRRQHCASVAIRKSGWPVLLSIHRSILMRVWVESVQPTGWVIRRI